MSATMMRTSIGFGALVLALLLILAGVHIGGDVEHTFTTRFVVAPAAVGAGGASLVKSFRLLTAPAPLEFRSPQHPRTVISASDDADAAERTDVARACDSLEVQGGGSRAARSIRALQPLRDREVRFVERDHAS